MNFTNKETYLAAVATWKIQYAAITQQIRDAKKAKRLSEQDYSRGKVQFVSYHSLPSLKDTASRMLDERATGKREAQRQYIQELNSRLQA